MRQSAWLKRLGLMLRVRRPLSQVAVAGYAPVIEPKRIKKPVKSDSRHAKWFLAPADLCVNDLVGDVPWI
jgi:hypothetical protein